MSKLEDKIKGVLCLFGETGYEGSPWAFNDPKFNYENTSNYVCKKCNRFWNKENDPEGVEDIEGDYCKQKEHDFKLTPKIYWSHDGLHILKTGDYLKIFDKENIEKTLWEGEIEISNVLKKTKFNRGGKEEEVEILTYQLEKIKPEDGVTWFSEEYSAELTKKLEASDTNL